MELKSLHPCLLASLTEIVNYRSWQFDNTTIRDVLKNYIVQDAEKGFGTYYFEVLPQVEKVFDFITQAEEVLVGDDPIRAETSSLQYIIDWVVALSHPVCIYKLEKESHSGSTEPDLLIVLNTDQQKSFKEYSTVINTARVAGSQVEFSIFHWTQLVKLVGEGNIFYIQACNPKNLVYDSGQADLNLLAPIDTLGIKERAECVFASSYRRAEGFYEGAKGFSSQKNNELSAFMLHQAAEQVLRGAILSVTGLEYKNHLIKSLLKSCFRFAPELEGVFVFNNHGDARLIKVLESVYLNSRYKEHFEVSDEDLFALFEKVEAILNITHSVVDKIIAAFRL